MILRRLRKIEINDPWKNICPWTDEKKLKLIGKFGMERVWKIFISEKYGKYGKEYLN